MPDINPEGITININGLTEVAQALASVGLGGTHDVTSLYPIYQGVEVTSSVTPPFVGMKFTTKSGNISTQTASTAEEKLVVEQNGAEVDETTGLRRLAFAVSRLLELRGQPKKILDTQAL